jgi:hypothetical protein
VSVVKAAMRKVHGREKVDADVSMYYLTLLIVQGSQAIRLSEAAIDWAGKFTMMTRRQLAKYLCRLCGHQDLESLQKTNAAPKNPHPNEKLPETNPTSQPQECYNKINHLSFLPSKTPSQCWL